MDIGQTLQQIGQDIVTYLPTLLTALAILVIGWLIALAIAAVVRGALRRIDLDNRIARRVAGEEPGRPIQVTRLASQVVFWVIMLLVLVAFFQVLGLTSIIQPLNQFLNQIFLALPSLIGAAALIVIAWITATVLRAIVSGALRVARLDERVSREVSAEGEGAIPLSKTLGDVVYWLVFLLFLPAVLDALSLQGLLQPVQSMIDQVLAFLPSLVAAGLILVVGWFVARVVQRIVTNLLAAIGTDRLSDRIGLAQVLGKQKLSGVLGLIVYILILVPVLIAALNALGLDAITGPASNMLNTILAALPALFGAALLLGIAYAVGRVVASLATSLLTGIGFNNILARLGIGAAPAEGQRTPSEIVGYLTLVAIMLFAGIEAARIVGFVVLATSLTLGSGNSGGVFAPALFTGAALGGAFGWVVESLAPGATAGPGAFAIVGMAAMFAGAARAPFTAILIVFEMTDDYQLIVPLMASVVLSLIVAERLHRESIYTLKLTRRGIHLRRGRDVDVMEAVRVDEVMVRQPVTVSADLPVTLLAGEFLRTGRHGFPVLNDEGGLFGIVSLERLSPRDNGRG